MAESSSKRRESEENEDRISVLPQSVLCHILSFLPTKACVATSLLSRRWLHLWEHLQVFDFYDNSLEFDDGDEQSEQFRSFAVFVSGVLSLRRSRDIRKMRLSCAHSLNDTFYAQSVDTWIYSAIGPHLQELHLSLVSTDGRGFVLPQSLFTCTSLLSLSLSGGIHVQVQRSTVVRLPSLKTLQIDVGYADVDYLNVFFSGCPILETLDLTFSPKFLNRVRVPRSLKRLKLTVENDVGAFLDVDAPGLKHLCITKVSLRYFGDLPNVVEADIDTFSRSESPVALLRFLTALSGTKYLVLRLSTIKWLLGPPCPDFPEFRYLLRLELILPCFDPHFLGNVLQKCPMLQVLIVQNDMDESLGRSYWPRPPTPVPNCLVSHLTSIHLKGFGGWLNEMEFTEYILRSGLVLKTMIITDITLDLSNKHSILKKLSDMPRGSSMCQLRFD